MANAHLLIADITGSTKLFDQETTAVALGRVRAVLDRMRAIIAKNNGKCIKSVGDDTLSIFPQADEIFQAARTMIETDWADGLGVHIGAHWGDVVLKNTDLYGDAVITTARLASLAKPGELLVGGAVFTQLSKHNQALFVSMGDINLKGKSEATRVHSFTVGELDSQTVFKGVSASKLGRRTQAVVLNHQGTSLLLTGAQSVVVGRSPECEVVLDHPWVSRKHGKFELRSAQLEYTDHSSSGSTVVTKDGREFALKRRATLLNGEGMVLVGINNPEMVKSIIYFATNDLIPDSN